LDHTRPLAEARRLLKERGRDNALQGNLEPETLLLEPEAAAERARGLLSQWGEIASRLPSPDAKDFGPTGWVFNLGHGVPAEADPATVEAVVKAVKGFDFGCGSPGASTSAEAAS
jgi:uroporphyrinogen-III decarboxylase